MNEIITELAQVVRDLANKQIHHHTAQSSADYLLTECNSLTKRRDDLFARLKEMF